MKSSCRPEQLDLLPQAIKWFVFSCVIGIFSGTASALFLASLDFVTSWRESHRWIITALPVAGFLVGWIYLRFGKEVEGGNDLIIDEIHSPQNVIPLRMTPLILISSVVTHLFGGSAGREGTAIQMGGSLADQLTSPFKLSPKDRRIVLMAGISGGFGSVFGTPLAGTVFGLEVLSIGKLRYEAIFPCLIAAIVGDKVTQVWGIHHSVYQIPFAPEMTLPGLLYSVIAGVVFGIVGMLFANTIHGIAAFFKKHVSYPPLRPFIGGIIVASLVWITGTTKYIGLGVPTILDAFKVSLPPWDFAGKFLMTVLTLGSGFKGGEVTPLFFIGATLGNALSLIFPLPSPLLAGMGFAAIFAGAANTPLACMLMGIELFGSGSAVYVGVACVVSYLFSGHTGIYHSQRIGSSKHHDRGHEEGLTLGRLHSAKKNPEIDKS